MKVTTKTDHVTREVLIGMAVNDKVIARISPKWVKEGLFASQWANLIGSWCVKHHKKYGKAPNEALEGMYVSWSENADKDAAKMVGKFLESLDGEYRRLKKSVNSEYLVDQATALFTQVKRQSTLTKAQGFLDQGKGDEFDKLMAAYSKIEIEEDQLSDLFLDEALIREATSENGRDVLFQMKGPLGRTFFRQSIERDGFLAFLGPEKRGKTYQMLEMAYQAMRNRCRVAFFEVGDLTRKQISRRFAIRNLGLPKEAKTVRIPKSLELTKEGTKTVPVVAFDERDLKGLTPDAAWKACQKVMQDRIKSKESFFKLGVYPTDSITADGVRQVCLRLAESGWPPDIVFIDYADILAPPPGYRESRDAINSTWKTLSRLRQELHCCVVTATQANAASYQQDSLDMSNFSEDKRKFAHVTGMIGLNQSPDEKLDGLLRYNWLVLREEEFLVQRFCYLAGCLDIANPCLLSAM